MYNKIKESASKKSTPGRLNRSRRKSVNKKSRAPRKSVRRKSASKKYTPVRRSRSRRKSVNKKSRVPKKSVRRKSASKKSTPSRRSRSRRKSVNKKSRAPRKSNKSNKKSTRKGAIPLNMKLYNSVKRKAAIIYKKPSAYKSGYIVKEYKRQGGKYKDGGGTKNLKRWYKEKWRDVGHKKYPVYIPTKRISAKTPLTTKEIDAKNLKKQIALKQKIKGNRNLPAFKKKKKSK